MKDVSSSYRREPLVGLTLDDRYALVSHLATGGMANVYRGRDLKAKCDVAVKVMRPDLVSASDLVERFRREADILRRLDHRNVVRVTHLGKSREGLVYLVMDLLTGETLFERLRRERTLPPDELVPILVEVCAGLEAAHSLGVVHRDLKPENVFLARVGKDEVAKILDFGIAKFPVVADADQTATGVVVGTPEYLSPEQATGSALDGRADLYSVGLIAWRSLVGHHPFLHVDPKSLLRAQADAPVPALKEGRPVFDAWPALDAVIARTCAKQPSRRPESASELAQLLKNALERPGDIPQAPLPEEIPPSTKEGSLPGEPGKRRVGGRAKAFAVLGAVALALVLVVVLALPLGTADKARHMLLHGAPRAALDLAQAGLLRRPGDPGLLELKARALLSLPARANDGLEALAESAGHGPLSTEARQALVTSLGPKGSVAVLLDGSDCAARRRAAELLGLIREPCARTPLLAVSRERRPGWGEGCGATEAKQALKQIDAQ